MPENRSHLTRSGLIDRMAERYPQFPSGDIDITVRIILDAMVAELVGGGRIEIRGFGSFSIRIRPPRTGRNPKTGARVAVPERRVPHFRPGQPLRHRIIGSVTGSPARK